MNYVELHCHSAYSFLDGASVPEELAAQAERLGYRALALTDHNGLYGSMEFARQAEARGIKPITGAEVTLENGCHLTLLARTPQGYAQLCRLLSRAHQEGERTRPRLRRELLAEHAAGLVLLTGCREGELSRALEQDDRAAAIAMVLEYREWFGPENVYLELQQNLVHGDTERIQALTLLARELDLKLVATNNVHYHVRERHRLQDAVVAIRHGATLDNSHVVRRANSEFYLKTAEEMEWLFRTLPEALRSTEEIAEKCADFNITKHLGYLFPDFQRTDAGNGSADQVLSQVCWSLLEQRYRREPEKNRVEAARRVQEELALIRHHKLSGFFLVYRDLLELGKEIASKVRPKQSQGRFALPPGRGRGSSVSSIVCYLIGLSPVDPVRAKLKLGRFLNKELASVPDIDLDFPREIREELIKAVHQRYGSDHAAMVCTFSTYRLRGAVREMGKALGLPAADLDRLARLSENGRGGAVEEEMRRLPGFERALESQGWKHLIWLASQLAGFPRHLSQHPGGIIISSRPLVELVPVEHSAMDGRLVCQWDKDSCDDARFIKIDFLALGILSAVEDCLDLIERNGKPAVDLTRVDLEEPEVYDRICSGDTVGTFQIESRAQIQMLPRTQPRSIADLTVEVAIVRPGPIVGGFVNPYIQRRELLRRRPDALIYYEHALLKPVLEDTLGSIIFQDQVLGVCQALAGFSVGRAEALRRAMSRRRSREAMEEFREEFVQGAERRGVGRAVASRIFESVLGFSQYGFPKAHAASFAVLAYQSVWLCHHYPAEYIAGLLNSMPMGFYPRDVLIKDAQRHGVQFDRPDVNASQVLCTVSGDRVRLGLSFIAGIADRAAERMVEEREGNGPYRSVPDIVRRVALTCGELEKLIEGGACDSFGIDRRMLLWDLGLFLRAQGWLSPGHPRAGSPTAREQGKLALPIEQDRVALPATSGWEKMLGDYRMMELSPDGHPMAVLRRALPKGLAACGHLKQLPDGNMVRIAGMVVTRQRPGTAKGFLFLLMEDETGLANVIVSPGLYEERRAVMRGEPLIWVEGRLQQTPGHVNVVATNAGSLLDALRDVETGLREEDPVRVFLNDLRQAAPAAHQWR